MPDPSQLSALVRLYDDPSQTVRTAVLAELAGWDDGLESALRTLDDPPSDEVVAAVLAAVASRHEDMTEEAAEQMMAETAAAVADELIAEELAETLSEDRPRKRPRFTVGQLVRHRRYGYRGVIVARDEVCLAPDEWYEANRTQPDREQPWYHVLVHDSENVTYAAQSSLRPDDSDDAVEHPWVDLFFDGRQGARYLRNDHPWPPGQE
jgi:heat shock protein HspQ